MACNAIATKWPAMFMGRLVNGQRAEAVSNLLELSLLQGVAIFSETK